MNLQVRIATRNDADLIATIGWSTFEQTFAKDNSLTDMQLYLRENFQPSIIENELKDPDTHYILAIDKNSVAGYAKFSKKKPPAPFENTSTLELERIYALKEYIGKKVGATLIEYALGYATMNRYQVIWLGVWEKNFRAIEFYNKWGFTIFGSHVFMLGNDAQTDLLMMKKL